MSTDEQSGENKILQRPKAYYEKLLRKIWKLNRLHIFLCSEPLMQNT